MPKYRNTPTTIDGIQFDSKAESLRYLQLRQMQEDGEISNLKLQPTFELQPKFMDASGVKHRAIVYRADFLYEQDGKTIVEDVKGMRTQQGVLRMKMFRYHFRDIVFKEIRV